MIHNRRDEIFAQAEKAAKKMGHRLGKWAPTFDNQCLKCGMIIHCNNIIAPTDGPDLRGSVLLNRCSGNLDGGYFESDKGIGHNKPATVTVV